MCSLGGFGYLHSLEMRFLHSALAKIAVFTLGTASLMLFVQHLRRVL
jgi:hypothetical protein